MRLSILVGLVLFSLSAFSQPAGVVRIQYLNPIWNLNPEKLDTGKIVIRNKETGLFELVELVETEPDSGEFTGQFPMEIRSQALLPEIYDADPRMTRDKTGKVTNMDPLISTDAIKRKPLIVFKSKTGTSTMMVFRSSSDAMARKENIDREKQIEKLSKIHQLPLESTLDTEAVVQNFEARKKADADAKAREGKRKEEELKVQKEHEDLIKKFVSLPPDEKDKRRKAAKEFAEAGLDLYRANSFKEAEKNFRKAYESDPDDHGYFFQYGVTLQRLGKSQASNSYLKMASGPAVPRIEKEYFIATNHYKLKEFIPARYSFDLVRKSGDQNLAPMGEFYIAIMDFDEQNYDKAYDGFQKTLDTSNDSKVDQICEDYIEQINKLKMYMAVKAKKFFITLGLGGEYDSNLLLRADTATQSSSNKGSSRLMGSGSFEWRPLFKEKHELSFKLSVDGQYTSSNDLAPADVNSYMGGLIYRYKGTLFSKPYKMDFNPSYLILYNDPTNTGTKKVILNSIPVSMTNTLIMNDRWFFGVNLVYSQDTSKLESSTGDDDSSATKYQGGITNIIFTGTERTHAFLIDGKYTLNKAVGKNVKYTKIDGSLGFMMPFFWDMTFIPKLTYYTSNYAEKVPVRTDTNLKLGATFIKSLNEWLNLTLDGGYIINNSTIPDSYQYKKYVVDLLATAKFSF